MKNPYLVGDKVYLRPFEAEDAAILQRFINDPAVSRQLLAYRPYTLAMEKAYIENSVNNPTDLSLGICLKSDDHLIGTASLHQIHEKDRRAEFGIAIGDQRQWGKGYGTEVTRLMTQLAFETLNLNRVSLTVYDFNERGIRAYTRVGYQREGVLRQYTYIEGAYHDGIVMSMLRSDWERAKAAIDE